MGLFCIFKLTALLYISCVVCVNAEKPNGLVLWCRYCSAVVGETSHIFSNVVSPGAIKTEQRYMFGKNVTVQTLVNPFHFVFDVITTENASCADVGRSIGGRTWFPGYSWRVCTCPRCSAQLGWTFEREITNNIDDENDNKCFHVLMLRSLLGLTEDDDPGVGMLSYLKYSKPFKPSTESPFHPRARDNTTSIKHNNGTLLIPIAAKDKEITKTSNIDNHNMTVLTETRYVNPSGFRTSVTISTNNGTLAI